MRIRAIGRLAALAWSAAALLFAAAALAPAAHAATTATIGPPTLVTSSTATLTNLCVGGEECTYLQFAGSGPASEYVVPFDGTIVRWRVASGSAGGAVRLRILRPAGAGRYVAVGTSATQTLSGSATAADTFTTSLPVRAGDLIGLDNASSALLFRTGVLGEFPEYWTPFIVDGAAASAPTAPGAFANGYQLQLNADVQATVSGGGGGGGTGALTLSALRVHPARFALGSAPAQLARVGSGLAQLARVGSGLAQLVRVRTPVGTTISFQLSAAATVTLRFAIARPGRLVGGSCVSPRPANRHARRCTRFVVAGTLVLSAHQGLDRLAFAGRLTRRHRLVPGRYRLTATALDSAGRRAGPARAFFTLLAR